MKSKIKPNYFNQILCFILLNALCILAANCNSSKTSKKANHTPKSTDIEASRFNSEKFVDHDKAIALWILKQDFALTVMSKDNQGNVRISAFKTYSEHKGRDRDTLVFQKSALDEFISSYNGNDKGEILQIWLDSQEEAKDSLKSFLDSVDMNTDVRDIENSKDKNEYDKLILIQEYYMDQIDVYRKEWRDYITK